VERFSPIQIGTRGCGIARRFTNDADRTLDKVCTAHINNWRVDLNHRIKLFRQALFRNLCLT
jgi:hypothetical protein